MSKLAIDVVILPPVAVMELAIDYNKYLAAVTPQSIVLSIAGTFPHLSLLMGGLAVSDLGEATRVLKHIAAATPVIELKAKGINTAPGSPPVSALDIELSDDLARLQRTLIEDFRPVISNDVTEEDLFDPPPVAPSAVDWINRFINDQSGGNFWPHITLGHGASYHTIEAFNFRATRMAICHLGDHCTCRKILAEASFATAHR